MRNVTFIYCITRERISAYFLCFSSATLGCVPVYGLLTEECSQHFDHHHSVFVHLLCYWSSALPGKEVKWTAQVLIERFSIEFRKTKTKVITLANHKGHR